MSEEQEAGWKSECMELVIGDVKPERLERWKKSYLKKNEILPMKKSIIFIVTCSQGENDQMLEDHSQIE